MNWHSISIKEALMELNVTANNGLNSQEIMRRQKTFGMNVLNEKKSKPLIYKFISQFSDFMIITLLFAAFISFFGSYLEGNPNYIEPSIILIIISLNAILGVVHESKAERSLEALKKMSAPNAHVIRNGIRVTVEASDLVPGDIILLETGCFVPADARLITSINLKVEESSLTGESDSVEKYAGNTLKPTTNIADRNNLVMATTVVTYGRAKAIAKELGILSNKDMAMTGEELSRISDKELASIIHNYSVFARVSPEHKVRIVKAFQNRGEGLFAHGLMYKIIFEGILIGSLSLTAFVIGVKYYDVNHLISPVYGRTMAFAVLSISQLFHSFNMKSNHSLSEIGVFSNPKLVLSFIPIIILEFQKSINSRKTIKE